MPSRFDTADASQDGALWAALRRRDPDAYRALEARIRAVCGPALRARGAGPQEVADLLQEVLVGIWRFAEHRDEEPRNLDAFLHWRARGVWSNWRRHRAARPSGAALEEIQESPESAEPQDTLVLQELDLALERCRRRLQGKYADVWTARYDLGLDTDASARKLATTKARVAVLLHRARRLLEDCMRSEGWKP